MNRLISVAIEHPGTWGLGIDEATALLVEGKWAEVVGESQVVAVRSRDRTPQIFKGRLGSRKMDLRVYLPGQRFVIR